MVSFAIATLRHIAAGAFSRPPSHVPSGPKMLWQRTSYSLLHRHVFEIRPGGDGHAPARAEGAIGHLQAGGGLFAFEFCAPNHPQDAADGRRVEPGRDDLAGRLMLLDVALQDIVEDI